MADVTYNGWKNYETWAVNLWINNDEGSHRTWVETAERIYAEARPTKVNSKAEQATLDLANVLKEVIEGDAPDLGSSLYADLLNAALSAVYWLEIAKHYIDDLNKHEE